MREFVIYPAIDLRSGRVVRLQQGDPNRQTNYSDDPVLVARQWIELGASWIHVVNLDGALGDPNQGAINRGALAAMCRLGGARVQFGGGMRSLADVEAAFEAGVARLVLGTAAVENPRLVADALARYSAERIVVGLDAREGMIVTRGWTQTTPLSAIELGQRMREMGVAYALYTEVNRDGMMCGPAAELTAALAQVTGLKVIASGGVRHIDDVRELMLYAPRGVAGVVIGRALYEGALDLRQAIALTQAEVS
ncbi:MAG: 1-(5-phosphoribosyl)-5-[(5-phosphoribosylamino)methylideneamino]imidazole-4-carboxamide isomerase [Anaerolineae bacterium]|nr:1-(5-phosphoribosyl)-5-[(5-phosphoribosylamino)methylideneamino]imidazole-4-carboxamide isomerase [Anaerolineae bacterium]